MNFPELLEWQWSDYADKHQDKASLLLHIVAIPVFWMGTLDVLGALLFRGLLGGLFPMIGGFILIGLSLFMQGKGHEREKNQPTPFKNSGEAVMRILCEQFITFPRFVLSGGWWKNLNS